MSKFAGKKNLFDYLKFDKSSDDDFDDEDDDFDDDDYDDDDYDDDDYDDEEDSAFSKKSSSAKSKSSYSYSAPKSTSSYQSSYSSTSSYSTAGSKKSSAKENVVSFDAPQRRRPSTSEVYVIKPQALDDAQTVVDSLKSGKTIVINMEGLQLDPAQRIIDFICGACYGIEGELKAISANIFIAAPNNIEISGDLREELIGDSSLSPHLG